MNSAILTKEEEERQFRERVIAKKKQLEESPFWQQNIKTWRPVYDAKHNFLFFFVLSLFFFGTGYFIQSKTNEIAASEFEVEYSDQEDCRVKPDDDTPNMCHVGFKLNNTMTAPIYVYYKIDNMYQNHRRYVKSRSYSQLAGKYHSAADLKGDCDPVTKVGDLYRAQQFNLKKQPMNTKAYLESPAIPCGLMAKSFFNDTLNLYKNEGDDKTEIVFNTDNIAWTTDVGKFSNIKKENLPSGVDDYKSIQWQDMTDPRFIVWMRNAGLPNFRKLYGIIDEDLKPGYYKLEIDAQYNVAPFEGKKKFALSNANVLGGKNVMLYYIYFIAGAITTLMTLGFYCQLAKT